MQNILIIHPDLPLVNIHKNYLSGYFLVDSAFDGLSGLRKIKQNNPSLIVSDYNLPVVSAGSLLKFVRSHPKFYKTPYIILSQDAPVDDSMVFGANAWLPSATTSPQDLIEVCLKHLKIKTHV